MMHPIIVTQTEECGARRSLTEEFSKQRVPSPLNLLLRQLQLNSSNGKLLDTLASIEQHKADHQCMQRCSCCDKESKFPDCQKPKGLLGRLAKSKDSAVRICRVCRTIVCVTQTSTCGKQCLLLKRTQSDNLQWTIADEGDGLLLPVCGKCLSHLRKLDEEQRRAADVQWLIDELQLAQLLEQLKEQQVRVEGEVDILLTEPIHRMQNYRKQILAADVLRAERQLEEQLSKLSAMLARLRASQGRLRQLADSRGLPRSAVAAVLLLSTKVHTARAEAYFELRPLFYQRFRTLLQLVLASECKDPETVQRALEKLEFDALSCAFVRVKQLCFEMLSLQVLGGDPKEEPRRASCPVQIVSLAGDRTGSSCGIQIVSAPDAEVRKGGPTEDEGSEGLCQFLVKCVCALEEQIALSARSVNENLECHSGVCEQLVREQFETRPLVAHLRGRAIEQGLGAVEAEVREIVRNIWYELERRVLSEWKLAKVRSIMLRDSD